VSARVEVRIEDFKAFVKKLAEGETTVGPDIYPKEETQRKKKENAKDIIINSVLIPIIEGSALEFIVGRSEIYSEWERSVPPQNIQIVRNLMQTRRAPSETIVVPVEIKINPSFLQNARQTVEAIAFEKRRVDMKLRGSRPCQEAARSIRDFDSKRDGLLSFSGNNLLSDIYFFKDVAEPYHPVTNSLAEGIKILSLTDATNFLPIWTNSFPNLLVSLLGSEGVVREFLITRKQGKSSSDGRAFTDNGWSPLHVDVNGPGSCLVIEPTATMHLFLSIPSDELQRVNTIKFKIESN